MAESGMVVSRASKARLASTRNQAGLSAAKAGLPMLEASTVATNPKNTRPGFMPASPMAKGRELTPTNSPCL